jgi:hypothetical protein
VLCLLLAASSPNLQEPYASVMQRAFKLGVTSFKSAGNQGAPSAQGLFWVDAYTGAGSTMVAAADTSSGVVGPTLASFFSTYGPVRTCSSHT